MIYINTDQSTAEIISALALSPDQTKLAVTAFNADSTKYDRGRGHTWFFLVSANDGALVGRAQYMDHGELSDDRWYTLSSQNIHWDNHDKVHLSLR